MILNELGLCGYLIIVWVFCSSKPKFFDSVDNIDEPIKIRRFDDVGIGLKIIDFTMSSLASELVKTITGMYCSPGLSIIESNTSIPSFRGILRSSSMRSGRGLSAYVFFAGGTELPLYRQ